MNLELLQSHGKVRTYQKEEIICMEKEQGHTAYLLLKGTANVLLRSFHDKPKVVAVLNPGVIFGEMSLLEDKPRTASILANEDGTMALEIGKDNFLWILQSDGEIAYNLLRTLSSRVEKCIEDMKGSNISYVIAFQRNELYPQIQGLTQGQFQTILQKDPEHAMKILRFLSRFVADIDQELTK